MPSWAVADSFLQEKWYTEALELLEVLENLEGGSEALWYRLAFLHEERGNYPMALFYLRKLELTCGGHEVEAKILQLQEQIAVSAQSLRASPGKFYRYWYRFKYRLLLSLGLLLLIAVVSLGSGRKDLLSLAAALSGLVLLGGLTWTLLWVYLPKPAVIVRPTSLYQQAAYASPRIPAEIKPGTLVVVWEHQDLWRKVAVGGVEAWVPEFAIKAL